uniref:Craniofacial development protein 2-like n=1 Tax=Nicotiana tabacum TaxID=4097 RepID=A0A1S3YUL1_TOBAC|nr:PREDICTED: craniofacial development protein 2-like [Nicotiana tabacum]
MGVRGGTGGNGGKGIKGAYRLRIESWNIGTLTGKSIELAKILQKRKVNIACVQETRKEELDEIVRSIPLVERLLIRGDFNGHIGSTAGGYGEVHGDFGYGDRNVGGTLLLDFAKAFEMVIANSSFPKREEHLVTF